jgi:hypothetical protein
MSKFRFASHFLLFIFHIGGMGLINLYASPRDEVAFSSALDVVTKMDLRPENHQSPALWH